MIAVPNDVVNTNYYLFYTSRASIREREIVSGIVTALSRYRTEKQVMTDPN